MITKGMVISDGNLAINLLLTAWRFTPDRAGLAHNYIQAMKDVGDVEDLIFRGRWGRDGNCGATTKI